jgi:hypothetical protein
VDLEADRVDALDPARRLAGEQLRLDALDVHLHVVDPLARGDVAEDRVHRERARRRARAADAEAVLLAGAGVVGHLAVLDPDRALDDLHAVGPRRRVAPRGIRVAGVELDGEDPRVREHERVVRDGHAGVRAEVEDPAHAARGDLRRRRVHAVAERIAQHDRVGRPGPQPDRGAAERAHADRHRLALGPPALDAQVGADVRRDLEPVAHALPVEVAAVREPVEQREAAERSAPAAAQIIRPSAGRARHAGAS